MSEPMTEAGRAHAEVLHDAGGDFDRPWVEQDVCAIEDEAARMERERIATVVRDLFFTQGMNPARILAALTDTGEEAAS